MIVADTNLLLGLYLPTPGQDAAEQVLRRDPVWSVPLLWRSEFRNVLAGVVRAGRIDRGLALELLDAAASLVGGNEYAPPSDVVLDLAVRSGCSAYDCEFVALAEELGAVVVTSDKQVLAAFPGRAVAPESFTA